MRNRTVPALLLCVVAALALAGCGGSNASSTGDGSGDRSDRETGDRKSVV